MASPIDVLVPLRLLSRAADDLNRLVTLGERALDRMDRLDAKLDQMLALGERIEGQAAEILVLGERVSAQAEELGGLGSRMETLGRDVLQQGTVLQSQADAMVSAAGELAEAMPTIEHAVTMVSPLEGAVQRLGRTIDRLPGGRPRVRPEEEEPGPEENT